MIDNMKYGLITYKDTENIGDDIQSYVAIRFLPKVDYYLEREELDRFVPNKKEQIITIMNGWYLHSKINFPISPYIYPLYISTHFSAYNSGGISTEYLNEYSKKELEKYAPIGCRDTGTVKLLNELGVDNYFSGCLTLTIQADKNIEKKNHICIVDIDEKAEKYVRDNLSEKHEIIKKTHTLDASENSKLSWEERFNNVKELLDTYQSASLVITSRLHCALPCLALGTPVLLLYDENKEYTKDRLGDYVKILTSMSTAEFLDKGLSKIKKGIKNPVEYQTIRNNVESKVKELLENVNLETYKDSLPSIEDYKKFYVVPKENIDNLYRTAAKDIDSLKRECINLGYARDYWKKEFDILLKKSNLENINNMRYELSSLLTKYESLVRENKYLRDKLSKYEKKKNKEY